MKLTRAIKSWVCLLMVGVMLFAQMSLAAYACPGAAMALAPASTMEMAMDAATDMAVDAAMVDCGQMRDQAQPNLCAEHHHHTQQSDQAQTPTLPAMLLISLYTASPQANASEPSWPMRAAQSIHLDAEPPPLSILHCCFRL